MIKKLVGKELIEQSLLELIEEKTIEQITVTEIAKNCGITTRTFYYYFTDKHEVVSSIYTHHMEKFMDSSLNVWYEEMVAFFDKNRNFMKNTLGYMGQNNLGDIIIDLEWVKLKRHIKPETLANRVDYLRTTIAIEYMLHGNLGVTRSFFTQKKQSALELYMPETYDSMWSYMSANFPPLILQNLSIDTIDFKQP